MGYNAGYIAVAYMTHGRWVARCPRPGCVNAEAAGRCDDGTEGGLRPDHFVCRTEGWTPGGRRAVYGGCGLVCEVDWPAEISELERVLAPRPPAARNWTPGETVETLTKENLMHHLVPEDALNGGPSRTLLEFVDGRPVDGLLSFTEQPRQLEAGR